MTTKRIRCICGRVYDPIKRPACPDCGAPHVAAAPAPEPVSETPAISKAPATETPAPFRPSLSVSPRQIVLGTGVLVLLIIVLVLSRCGGKEKPATVAHESPKPQSTANPVPSTPAPAPTTAPPAPPLQPPGSGTMPGPTTDLAAMLASAAPGATIKVPPGVYPGGLILARGVRIIGESRVAGQVVIQSEGRECLSVRAPGVVVQNVQFVCNGIGELPAISVGEGAELELEACKVQSGTAVGVAVATNGSLKTLGTTFLANNGTAVRLNKARGNFTQSAFPDARTGLEVSNGATAELHSCAFDRLAMSDPKGAIMAIVGAGTSVTADDCHFNGNNGSIFVNQTGALTMTNSRFKENGAGATGGTGEIFGLISVRSGGRLSLTDVSFDDNRMGVSIAGGGNLEMQKCRFTGNGLRQARQFFATGQPLSVIGQGSAAAVRQTTILDSLQFGVVIMANAKLTFEDSEISGSRNCSLAVGEINGSPAHVEVKRSRFQRNGVGLGVIAGSSANVEECVFHENQDGVIVFDPGSRVSLKKATLSANRDHGIYVYKNAEATVVDSDIQGNVRGALSGTRGKSSQRATVTLEDCRIGGNKTFGVGAGSQSALTLTRCVFAGTDKTNVYKERGAVVQTDAVAEASPTPGASPDPANESDQAETTPSPGRAKSKPRPRSRRGEDEAARFLRRILIPR